VREVWEAGETEPERRAARSFGSMVAIRPDLSSGGGMEGEAGPVSAADILDPEYFLALLCS
jgi:hypothetical protein